jgi:hypothetical protein
MIQNLSFFLSPAENVFSFEKSAKTGHPGRWATRCVGFEKLPAIHKLT